MQNFKKHCIGYLVFTSFVMVGCEFVSNKAPYDLAVEGNIPELTRLLDEGLDINKRYSANSGATLVFGAVDGESHATLNFLVEKGADINLKDNYKNTPLLHAVSNGKRKMAVLLLDHGARVSDINKEGLTALYMAVYRGNSEIAELLLDQGAKIHFQDEDGNTPLHVAARKGDAELVQLLLDRKAKVLIKNKRGFTPLYAPEELNYRKISDLLKKHGARMAQPAPTPSNLKKWYGQIVRKSPVRVRRVIRQESNFRKLVYSDDGMRVAGTFKKFTSNENIPPEFEDLELSMFVNMDELLGRRFTQSVRVFDTRTWDSLYLLTDKINPPSGDVFSLDGKYLLSGGKKSTVHVWDLAAGKVVRSFGKEKGNVLSLGKSSEKNYLLVGEQVKLEIGESTGMWDFVSFFFKEFVGETDHSLWLFDFKSGKIIRNLSGQKGEVFLARFTPDGRYVVSLGRNFIRSQGMLQSWNVETGQGLPIPDEVKDIKDLALFPDSKRLALAKAKEILIMDLESGKVLKRFPEGGCRLGLMDGGGILACSQRQKLILLDSETGEVISDMDFEKEFDKLGDDYKLSEYFTAMTVSPKGDTLLATTNHGKMIVFELKNS